KNTQTQPVVRPLSCDRRHWRHLPAPVVATFTEAMTGPDPKRHITVVGESAGRPLPPSPTLPLKYFLAPFVYTNERCRGGHEPKSCRTRPASLPGLRAGTPPSPGLHPPPHPRSDRCRRPSARCLLRAGGSLPLDETRRARRSMDDASRAEPDHG